MQQFIGCDAHKKFSVFVALDSEGRYQPPVRVAHERPEMRRYLAGLSPATPIALETSGCYYWMVEEMERAGHVPHLAHALTAQRRMQGRHKTNRRDAEGLAMLLRNWTLPRVWIPPAALRDQREMLRWRMALVDHRTQVKNRIHGLLGQYNLHIAVSDLFGDTGRAQLLERIGELPLHSQQSLKEQLGAVDDLDARIATCEDILQEMLGPSAERDLLDTLPGVGQILSAVLALEIGDVRRFGSAAALASYAGLVPVARESADWKRQEGCPRACNVYLKWAYVEAANIVAIHRQRWSHKHVAQLYERVRSRTHLHGKAAVAVGRHLAEASYWMLSKQQMYREPQASPQTVSPTHG